MHRQPTRIERLLALLLCVSLLNINPTLTIGVKGVATDPAFAPSAAVAQAEPTVTATPTAVPTSTPAALALAAFPAFPQSAQAASNALVPLRQTSTNLIRITDGGFDPATLTVFGPTDVTWINNSATTHTLRSGEPGTDPGGATKLFLPLVAKGSPSAVAAAMNYLQELRQQAASLSNFSTTLAPGQTFTYRFTTPGNHKFYLSTAPQIKGELALTGTALLRTSPSSGEDGVAATRETILEFSGPLDPATVTTAAFTARFGNRDLAYRLNLSPDKTRVTLFYTDPLPGSARMRVAIDGDKLKDAPGGAVDVNGDGVAGGSLLLEFDTLSLTVVPGTQVCGRVFASELAVNASNVSVNTPLTGVTISVAGLEDALNAKTDANGNFCLNPAPSGRFFVHIDGRTATNGVPAGAYYPFVGKLWQSTPGQQTNVGDAYLPLIVPGTLQAVNAEADTLITFPDAVLQGHPEFEGVMITVPANALFSDDGSRGGKVGIAPVPPDRLPGQLPERLDFPVVITVQTDGAENFDTPAPVCFPNLPDPNTKQRLDPGKKSALWSYDHDAGRWTMIGSMTVTTDGSLVCTDPSIGIKAPGWHGANPGTEGSGPFGGGNSNDNGDNDPPPTPTPPTPTPPTSTSTPPTSTPTPSTSTPTPPTSTPTPTPTPTACPEVQYPNLLDSGATAAGCIKDLFKLSEGVTALLELATKSRELYKQAEDLKKDYQNGAVNKAEVKKAAIEIKLIAESVRVAFNSFKEQTFGKAQTILVCLNSALALFDDTCRTIDKIPNECLSFRERNILKPYCNHHGWLRGSLESTNRLLSLIDTATSNLVVESVINIADIILTYLSNSSIASSESQETIDPKLLDLLTSLVETASPLDSDIEDTKNTAGIFTYLESANAVSGDLSVAQHGTSPNSFIIVEYRDFTQRLRSDVSGTYRVFLPANTPFSLSLFDPHDELCGTYSAISASAGNFTQLHGPPLSRCSGADSDRDGLTDFAEGIVGSISLTADSDSDGFNDYTEVKNGTNPLDGLLASTGIIGSADTPGTAVDICVENDLAVIADAGAGVAIFNVFDSMNPKLVAQVDTLGNAQRVACAGGRVAVADGDSGLAILDISTVANARIVHQINLNDPVMAVTTFGNVVYAGTAQGRVVAVSMVNGALIKEMILAKGVQDLAIQGEYLYALTTDKLYAIDQWSDSLSITGSADSPGTLGSRPKRLFIGGNFAYATHMKGYNTFDLTRPGQPMLIKTGDNPQFGWKQIVATGSGRGVAAVGNNNSNDGPHDISLYDVSDPNQTNAFLTQFETPGLAVALTLYKGRAYVADSQSGLQVINYLAYDSGKVPPIISLSTNFAAGKAEEAAIMRVNANTTDDVQVRLVEFYIDGKLVATDGTFPFEASFTTPRLAEQLSLTLRARAVDTGGNEAWTAEQTLALTQDATPPRITSVTPSSGALGDAGGNTITVTFNEAMAAASLTNASFKLFTFGPDQLPATADDVEVTGGTVTAPNPTTATLTFGTGLPADRYRAVLTTAVTDAIGNPLAGEFGWTFQLVPVIQIGDLINDAITVPHEHDIYHFTATSGQQIYVDLQSAAARLAQVSWQLTDATSAVLFDTCLGCGEPGVQTLTHGGTYTLTIGDNTENGVGVYSFKLWNVPPPQQFTINIGDGVSNGAPSAGAGNIESPGVKDHYQFSATPGQQVYIDLLSATPQLAQVSWQLTDETGAVLFDTCLGCGEPGVRTLTRGGVYTLKVGDDRDDGVGVYSFKLWNVPPPQQFTINIGDSVSNGVPGAGAGNIESAGSKDIYQFTATAGQRVRINLNNAAPQLAQVSWTLTDATSAVLFNTCLGCGDPGVKTLTRGGVYTLTVGNDRDDGVGIYQFQIIAQ